MTVCAAAGRAAGVLGTGVLAAGVLAAGVLAVCGCLAAALSAPPPPRWARTARSVASSSKPAATDAARPGRCTRDPMRFAAPPGEALSGRIVPVAREVRVSRLAGAPGDARVVEQAER